MAVEKRVRFKSWWLPWLLIAPQMAIILVFFFWPAGQAVYQSVLTEDAFGTSTEFVGLLNFQRLWNDETYLSSFWTTAVFSVLVAGIGLAVALLLAVMADRVIKGAPFYKTLLIWPYAVAPAIAGVLFLFMFAPSVGIAGASLHCRKTLSRSAQGSANADSRRHRLFFFGSRFVKCLLRAHDGPRVGFPANSPHVQ